MFLLRTLGGLSLTGPSLPRSAAQPRRLALLALLARGPGGRLSRDKLQAYLWPESSSEHARHALEQLLYASRRDLGQAIITTEGGELRLDAERVRADCTEFEICLDGGDLERGVGLCGGPFLDGFHLSDAPEFERWVDAERAVLGEKFKAALERLARDAHARNDPPTAAMWWRRRASIEPLNSRVALSFMQVLVEAGDRSGALRHAREHGILMREEMGQAPDAALTAFAQQLAHDVAPAEVPVIPRSLPTPMEGKTSGMPERESARAPSVMPGVDPPAWQREPVVRGRRVRGLRSVAAVLTGGAALVFGTRLITTTPANTPVVERVSANRNTPANDRTLGNAGAPDPAAHALYLRGQIEWNRRSRDGLDRSIVLFRQAIERDPTYAKAHAGLAGAYVILGYLGYVPGDAAFPKGKAAALQAIALDHTSGEAYAALGVALEWERQWTAAEAAFLRALEYAPDYGTGHQWYALLLTIHGRREEAVMHARRAAELDPLSIQIQNTYAIMLNNVGARDSALRVFERVVTYEPDSAWVRQNPWVLANFGQVAAAAGRHIEAVRLIERATESVPRHPRPLYELAVAYLAAGDRQRGVAAFSRADSTHPDYTMYRAFLHAHLGDLDAAFAWLDRVETWGPVPLLSIGGNPNLEVIRTDPRYRVFRRRLGLPEPR